MNVANARKEMMNSMCINAASYKISDPAFAKIVCCALQYLNGPVIFYRSGFINIHYVTVFIDVQGKLNAHFCSAHDKMNK